MKRSSLLSAVAITMVIPLTAFAYTSLTAKSTAAKSTTAKSTAATTTKSTGTSAKSSTDVVHHTHATKKIDINTASKEELMKLRGVDAATADKIIAARPFKAKGDLVSRNIVTKQEFEKITSMVTVKEAAKK